MSAFGRGPVWPDLAGTPTDPTAAFVSSSRVLELHEIEGDLACRVVISGVACRAIQLIAEVSTDGLVWREVDRKTTLGTTIGTHQASLHLTTPCLARIKARRYGGSANTLLAVHADARRELGERLIDDQPLELAGHQPAGIICWSDGAGAADTLGANWAAGPVAAPHWIPVGVATHLVLECVISAGPGASIEVGLLESPDDAITTYYEEVINSVAGGVVNQMPQARQLQSGAGTIIDGTYRAEFDVVPSTSVLVMARDAPPCVDLLARARFYRIPRL